MKHLFLKLSVVMLTLYFLAMSVSADPVDNQDTVDRRVILSADGSFTDEINTVENSKIQLRSSNEETLPPTKESKYSNLKVVKKTKDNVLDKLSWALDFMSDGLKQMRKDLWEKEDKNSQ